MKVKITGTGSCLPKLRVTNDDLGQIMETSDEWIRSRTGITARHIAVEETTTGMSTEAAEKQKFQRKMWISSLQQLFLRINIFQDLPVRCRKISVQKMQLRSTSMQRVPVFFLHWILRCCI